MHLFHMEMYFFLLISYNLQSFKNLVHVAQFCLPICRISFFNLCTLFAHQMCILAIQMPDEQWHFIDSTMWNKGRGERTTCHCAVSQCSNQIENPFVLVTATLRYAMKLKRLCCRLNIGWTELFVISEWMALYHFSILRQMFRQYSKRNVCGCRNCMLNSQNSHP